MHFSSNTGGKLHLILQGSKILKTLQFIPPYMLADITGLSDWERDFSHSLEMFQLLQISESNCTLGEHAHTFFSHFLKFHWSVVDLPWVTVSTARQSDSALHVHTFILFRILFPHRYHRTLGRVLCTIQQFPFGWSSIYLSVHMPAPNSQSIPHPYLSPLLKSLFSKSVSLFLFWILVHLYPFLKDFPYKWCHRTFIFHCLTSFGMIISRSMHAAANGIISFPFMAE